MTNGFVFFRMAEVLTKVEVPSFASQVEAGFPSPALEYSEEPIDFNKMLINDKEATFVVMVKGDSMIDAHVVPGSYLVVDKSVIPNSGDMIIAVVFNEFILKYYIVEGQQIWLVPANKNYKPLQITECHEFRIWGVVTRILINPKQIY